jgi:hypothetical protein
MKRVFIGEAEFGRFGVHGWSVWGVLLMAN